LTNQKSTPSFRAATRVSFQLAGPHVLQYVKLCQYVPRWLELGIKENMTPAPPTILFHRKLVNLK
jgi:hypothetical protein